MKKYEKQAVVYKDTALKEMANLGKEDINLDHGTIYVSTEEGNHGPRIKYYRGRPGNKNPSASISISKTPEVKEDSINLTASEKKELFKFIVMNKKVLLFLWVHGTELMKSEWDDKLKNLKKL